MTVVRISLSLDPKAYDLLILAALARMSKEKKFVSLSKVASEVLLEALKGVKQN